MHGPFFVRKGVKKGVEEEAARSGADEVTLKRVETCQKRFPSKMEDKVKGFQVEACFGSTGCPNRAMIADALPGELEQKLSKRKLKSFLKTRVKGPLKMHHEFRISISDCPNACSRPQIFDVGLIGACRPSISAEPCTRCGACIEVCRENALLLEGEAAVIDDSSCLYCGKCVDACPTGTLKEGARGYRVLIGGKLGRHPRLGTELPGIYDAEEVPMIVDQCVEHFQRYCQEGERFGEILERGGLEIFLKKMRKILKS